MDVEVSWKEKPNIGNLTTTIWSIGAVFTSQDLTQDKRGRWSRITSNLRKHRDYPHHISGFACFLNFWFKFLNEVLKKYDIDTSGVNPQLTGYSVTSNGNFITVEFTIGIDDLQTKIKNEVQQELERTLRDSIRKPEDVLMCIANRLEWSDS